MADLDNFNDPKAAEPIKMCTDMYLPDDKLEEAKQAALSENSDNEFVPTGFMGIVEPSKIAFITNKKWSNGRTIKVAFMDGNSFVKNKVMQFAKVWEQYANLKFDFGNHQDADIRISFRYSGSWSYVGTDCLSVPRNQPTMNFGWFDNNTPDEEFSRTTIHEFGHAIGCIHEHQHPEHDIPWNKQAVYDYYGGPPNNWSRSDIDSNIFQKYSKTQTQYSEFDKNSIMMYAIDNRLTIGNYAVGWNTQLSENDKNFARTAYPFPTTTNAPTTTTVAPTTVAPTTTVPPSTTLPPTTTTPQPPNPNGGCVSASIKVSCILIVASYLIYSIISAAL